jgi:immune inhibitor A
MMKSLLVLSIVLAMSALYAVPMSPQLEERLKAGGSYDQVVEILKEAKTRGVDSPNPHPFRSTRGRTDTLKAIAILVDFSDNVGTTPVEHYDTLLSSSGLCLTGSMLDYFLEASYGDVELITTVVGWFRMPQNYTYYSNNYGFGTYPMNAQRLAEDAVWAADPTVDFAEFDNNDDSFVDALFIIHAGPGAEVTGNPNHIWSHAWVTVNIPYVDGVYAYSYSTEPEDGKIGVFCHEAGHAVFGVPDMYDYDYDSYGLGNWSLMAYGSWNYNGRSPAHMDPYCRIESGFLMPQVVTSNQDSVLIPNVNYNQMIYKLWSEGNPGTEYFLVENRQRSGFDTYLPWHGLLIYHVDETMPNNNNQWYPGHPGSLHYLVALEQSDGLWQLEHYVNAGNSGDPYPGATGQCAFNDTTVPDSRDYDSTTTHVAVENISDSGDTMSADFKVWPTGVHELIEYAAGSIRLQVTPVVGNSRFDISFGMNQNYSVTGIQIYDAAGRLIKSLQGMNGASVWYGDDRDGRRVAPGIYFVMLNVEGSMGTLNKIQKIVFIR